MTISKVTPIINEMGTVFVHVKDLKKSVEWYSRILGFEVDLSELNSPVYDIPIQGTTGLTLDDHAFDNNFRHQPSSNPIFNLLVDDIDSAYRFIKESGAEIVREIERIGEHFAWFNFVDPDRNVLMACTC
ncbi:VOC family protein [Neobacillus sp. PS2-9]|uniref:VOC family protein n=1 Tax=Neobacillus sp. PS2-9 TaxID=3070676 RepID=UPI0027DF7059|nr:VOC family protein [Neobacillus sp. PS2-9]WML56135.1 VOC family protein [Neobacillus sp. PS2-9]